MSPASLIEQRVHDFPAGFNQVVEVEHLAVDIQERVMAFISAGQRSADDVSCVVDAARRAEGAAQRAEVVDDAVAQQHCASRGMARLAGDVAGRVHRVADRQIRVQLRYPIHPLWFHGLVLTKGGRRTRCPPPGLLARRARPIRRRTL